MVKFSKRLKNLREEKGLSTRQLAQAINVSDRAIQRWEKEERIPNVNAIILLAQFFGVSAGYLLGLEN